MSPHHPTDALDPATAAELAALDAALAGDPADSEWAALVAAIRQDAPTPRPRFRQALDERAAAGFPRERPAWLRTPRLHPRLVPTLAALSCVAVLLTVVGLATNRSQQSTDSSSSISSSPSRDAAPASSASDESSSASGARSPARRSSEEDLTRRDRLAAPTSRAVKLAPFGGGSALATRDRKVERRTTLGLTTDADGLQDAAGGIIRATQDAGGVVSTSQVDSSPAGGEASFVLRIPTDRVDGALKRFGELADVARLTQGSEDITGSFVSAQDRLSDARAERKALLKSLGKAATAPRIASLRARIRGNRTEIARLEGDVRGLRRRADLARVDVTLRARGTAADPDAGSAWGPGAAARDALRVLEVLAGVALVAGAVLLPLALLGGGAAVAGRGLRRRRREAALGA